MTLNANSASVIAPTISGILGVYYTENSTGGGGGARLSLMKGYPSVVVCLAGRWLPTALSGNTRIKVPDLIAINWILY